MAIRGFTVGQKVQNRQPQTARVWRQLAQTSAQMPVQAIDKATEYWLLALNQGLNLDAALDAAGNDFDFVAWLGQAAKQGWLAGVVPLHAS